LAHRRRLLARFLVCALALTALAITLWRVGAAPPGSTTDPETEDRARRIQSEIQDYAPPETNVPNSPDPGGSRQAKPTRQPQRAN